jgi:hypothetical protein
MKLRYAILATALLLGYGNGYSQENNVVLDYNQLTVGYMHNSIDLGEGDVKLDGIGISASSRFGNFVLGVGLGNSWIEDADASVLQVGAGVGYVFELSDSLHLVPSIGLDYEKIHDFTYYYGDSWVFTPSISLNYAVTESLELSVGVGYSEPFNTEVLGDDISAYTDGAFVGTVGGEYAISNNLGLVGGFGFSDNSTVFTIGLSLHY